VNDEPTRRLFFALWPDARVRRRLAAASRPLLAAAKCRPIADSRLHVTLAFLGGVPEAQMDSVRAAGDAVSGQAFALGLNRWGWWRQSKILMLFPSAPPPALGDLVSELRDALGDEGLPVERRRFRPHVTLARKCVSVRFRGPVAPVDWPVAAFALVESEFHSAGARYNLLHHWPLAAATDAGPSAGSGTGTGPGEAPFSDDSTPFETVGGRGL
jgi:2'-5' RNA ligase